MNRIADLVARSRGPADTAAIAEHLAEVLVANDVVVLGGDLGAGKTTFTKALGKALGIDEVITSPTFTLHQRYDGGRLPLHHLDVYRIDQIEEVVDLALPELFESEGVVVIEWGDKIRPALPSEYVLLAFAFGDDDDDRQISLTAYGASWNARTGRIAASLGDRLVGSQDA